MSDCSETDWNCNGEGWEDAWCLLQVERQCEISLPACQQDQGCVFDLRDDQVLCTVTTEPDYDYDICLEGSCVSPGACNDASCNVSGPHFPLADTGQRLCYGDSEEIDCPGTPGDPGCSTTEHCGQDAQLGWDAAEHQPSERYDIDNTTADQPLVTDNLTGLIWQGCAGELTGVLCTGGGAVKYTWEDALTYCDGLEWGRLSGWYLPDEYELQSIVDYGRSNPSIDSVAFPGTPLVEYFRTSSSSCVNASVSWQVSFDVGYVAMGIKTYSSYVRCVHR